MSAPIALNCDLTTILQVYTASKQSTQICSPANHSPLLFRNTHQKSVCLGCHYFLSPHSILIPLHHKVALLEAPQNFHLARSSRCFSDFFSKSLQLSPPFSLKSLSHLGFLPPSQPPSPAPPLLANHSWKPGRSPIPGSDNNILPSPCFLPAIRSHSSQPEALSTHHFEFLGSEPSTAPISLPQTPALPVANKAGSPGPSSLSSSLLLSSTIGTQTCEANPATSSTWTALPLQLQSAHPDRILRLSSVLAHGKAFLDHPFLGHLLYFSPSGIYLPSLHCRTLHQNTSLVTTETLLCEEMTQVVSLFQFLLSTTQLPLSLTLSPSSLKHLTSRWSAQGKCSWQRGQSRDALGVIQNLKGSECSYKTAEGRREDRREVEEVNRDHIKRVLRATFRTLPLQVHSLILS